MVLTGRGSYHSKNEEVERNRSQGCTKKRSPVLKESKLLGKKKKVLYFVFVIGIIRKKWVADPKKTPENNPQSSAVIPEQK